MGMEVFKGNNTQCSPLLSKVDLVSRVKPLILSCLPVGCEVGWGGGLLLCPPGCISTGILSQGIQDNGCVRVLLYQFQYSNMHYRILDLNSRPK